MQGYRLGFWMGVAGIPALMMSWAQNPAGFVVQPFAPNPFQYVWFDVGATHAVALKCDETIRVWGDNTYGQLGVDPMQVSAVDTPINPGIDSVIMVAAGAYHTVVLRLDGTVWTVGLNADGQLGDGTTTDRWTWDCVRDPNNINQCLCCAIWIAAGGNHTLVLMADSQTLYAFGANDKGQLCDGTSGGSSALPVQAIGVDTHIVQIDAGMNHTMVLQIDGTIKVCGEDFFGQLGDDPPATNQTTLVYVQGFGPADTLRAVAIAAGTAHSLALTTDSLVYGWGDNVDIEIHPSAQPKQSVPFLIVDSPNFNLRSIIAISAGSAYSLALRADGTVWAWGLNDAGQLGIGNFSTPIWPPQSMLLLGSPAIAIAAGASTAGVGNNPDYTTARTTLVFLGNDSLQAVGQDDVHQMGNNDWDNQNDSVPDYVYRYTIGRLKAFAGPDTVVCPGQVIRLGRGIPPEDTVRFTYQWTPVIGLDDPTLPNPRASLNVTSDITI